MITSLSPKIEFQALHKDCSEILSKERESRWLKVSLAYALAQCASDGLPAPVLKVFCDTLLNMAEKEVAPEPLPAQTLDEIGGEPEKQKKAE